MLKSIIRPLTPPLALTYLNHASAPFPIRKYVDSVPVIGWYAQTRTLLSVTPGPLSAKELVADIAAMPPSSTAATTPNVRFMTVSSPLHFDNTPPFARQAAGAPWLSGVAGRQTAAQLDG